MVIRGQVYLWFALAWSFVGCTRTDLCDAYPNLIECDIDHDVGGDDIASHLLDLPEPTCDEPDEYVTDTWHIKEQQLDPNPTTTPDTFYWDNLTTPNTSILTDGADVFGEHATSDHIDCLAGDDTVFAFDGTDIVLGRTGNDVIYGGDDDDNLQGHEGDDKLFGDAGDDLLTGSRGSDLLIGGTGDDLLFGGDDDDALHGQPGHDWISGGAGDDFVDGDAGDDIIVGDGGNDDLFGGAGDDIIEGGSGDDRLHGGEGDDIYIWRPGDGDDTIVDESGYDRLWIAGASSEDVQLIRSCQDLIILVSDSTIRVVDHFVGPGSGLNNIETEK
ncbi:Alkaline phosphatase [Enhygromyxa salina]|uniref:Alkaline phosphatase n=2 Tax=Enhygromyxa salina TaxID=215803 RepID=A0A0C2D1J9_9BACT|nr:Alkaline phosphatase [Enhygromyxa salina]